MIQHEDIDARRARIDGGDEGVDVGAEVAAVRLRQDERVRESPRNSEKRDACGKKNM